MTVVGEPDELPRRFGIERATGVEHELPDPRGARCDLAAGCGEGARRRRAGRLAAAARASCPSYTASSAAQPPVRRRGRRRDPPDRRRLERALRGGRRRSGVVGSGRPHRRYAADRLRQPCGTPPRPFPAYASCSRASRSSSRAGAFCASPIRPPIRWAVHRAPSSRSTAAATAR